MKNIVLSFICVLILGLSSCLGDKPANIQYYNNEPAIFMYSATGLHMIETGTDKYLAPELAKLLEPLNVGDLLLTGFEVDLLNQTYRDVLTASLSYIKRIYSSLAKPIIADEITDYGDPIKMMFADIKPVRKLLFFFFLHDAPEEQDYTYEMVYDDDSEEASEVPTLFIRAKKTNHPGGNVTEILTCFGFDMTSFINQYQLSHLGSKTVSFDIRYYTGIDGDDGYKQLNAGSHISWEVGE